MRVCKQSMLSPVRSILRISARDISPSNIGRIDFACNFRDCQFVESRAQCTRSSNWRALFNTRVDKQSFIGNYVDQKNMHADLLRYLAYFLTIQLDENITR